MIEKNVIEFIKQAFELQRQGHYKEAISVLYKVLTIEPDNIEVIVQIGQLFLLNSENDLAIEYFEKALNIDKTNLSALEGLSSLYKVTKNYEKALSFLNKALQISQELKIVKEYFYLLCLNNNFEKIIDNYPRLVFKDCADADIFFYIGFAYFNLKNIDLAEEFLQKSLLVNDKNPEAFYYLAKILFDKKDYASSDTLLSKMLNFRQSAKAYNLKGLIRLNLNNLPKAISYFEFATKINDKQSEYFYNLAIAYSLNCWYKEAEKNYKTAIFLQPDNLHYHYTLAYLYFKYSEYNKSKEELNFIKNIDENFVDAKILYAMILAQEGNVLESQKMLEAFLDQGIKHDFIYFALSKIYKLLQLYDKSYENINRALEYNKFSMEYLVELATLNIITQQYDEALKNINQILDINVNDIDAYLMKANVCTELNDIAQALLSIEKVIALNSNSAEAFYLKAKILKQDKELDKAIESIKVAITLSPDTTDYYKLIAELYFEKQDYASAYEYYKEIVNIAQEDIEMITKLADCAKLNNNYEMAHRNYFRAYTLSPQSLQLIINYTDILIAQNLHKKALRFLYNIIKKQRSLDIKNTLISKYAELYNKFFSEANLVERFIYNLFKI